MPSQGLHGSRCCYTRRHDRCTRWSYRPVQGRHVHNEQDALRRVLTSRRRGEVATVARHAWTVAISYED
jgi:hypothetical protein